MFELKTGHKYFKANTDTVVTAINFLVLYTGKKNRIISKALMHIKSVNYYSNIIQ